MQIVNLSIGCKNLKYQTEYENHHYTDTQAYIICMYFFSTL